MKILFLTHRLPYPPNRGDRIRAYRLLEAMSSFASVSLFSLVHSDEEAARVPQVPFADRVTSVRVGRARNVVLGALRLGSDRPLTHSLLDAPDAHDVLERLVVSDPPDLVVAFCSGMARFAMEPPLAGLPFVLDMVDVDSVKWAELGKTTGGPLGWVYRREAAKLSAFEARASRQARTTLVVNDRERAVLTRLAPQARVVVSSIGVDVAGLRSPHPPAHTPTVVFCGVMDYTPNVDGVRWFAGQVWPRVRAARPDARFLVVGSNPTRAVRALAEHDLSIEIAGSVPDVRPYLWQSAVSVAPLSVARGMQNKVLEALAAGLPAVVTPSVLAGLPIEAHAGCRKAEQPEAFADAVIDLLALTAAQRRDLVGRVHVERLSWSEALRGLEAILLDAASPIRATA